jgi:GntR family transcriptional regulator/MocR family aminotransferase
VDRLSDVPLHQQIATQIARALRRRSTEPARLPSSRTLAKLLGVSRNTILVAYDELTAEGLIYGSHGAGTHLVPAGGATVPAFDTRRLLQAAHYPAQTLPLSDPDGNRLYLNF